MLVRNVLECDGGIKNDSIITKTDQFLVINWLGEYNSLGL